MVLSSVTSGFTTGAGLIICIGSQNAFVLRQGLLRKHLSVVAFVCIVSDALLILSGISGLGILVTEFPAALEILRYAGALFLGVNAALAALRAWHGNNELTPSSTSVSSRNKVLLTCLGYTWLNPHVYIDTVFMLGSVSTHYAGSAKWEFGIGAILASTIWFLSITYGAKPLLPLFRSVHAWRILDAIVAAMLGYLSLLLVLSPLT
jgi:L-lysine exporter family protein LysE/ArgO